MRSQLEKYIAEELGQNHLSNTKNLKELCKIKREIANLRKKISELEARRTEIESQMRK